MDSFHAGYLCPRKKSEMRTGAADSLVKFDSYDLIFKKEVFFLAI